MGFTLVQTPQDSKAAPPKRYRLASPAPQPDDTSVFKSEPAVQAAPDDPLGTVKQAATGAGRGIINAAATVPFARDASAGLADMIAQKLGASPETAQTIAQAVKAGFLAIPGGMAPSGDEVIGKINDETGLLAREPQNVKEEYADTIGEFIPGVVGPGGPVRKAAQWLLPALASETAGQVTKGSEAEPLARMAFGFAGGMAAAGSKVNAAKEAAKNAPQKQAVDSARDKLYGSLRNAGIKYDANAYGKFTADLRKKLDAEGLDDILHPSAAQAFKRIEKEVATSPDFTKMEALRQIAGDATRGFDPKLASDRRLGRKIVRALDQFSETAPFTAKPGMSRSVVKGLSDQARATAQRSIKARKITTMLKEAEGYSHGLDAGLRAQFQKLERDIAKGKERGWTPTEIAAIKTAAHGTKTSNALNTIGRAGVDLGVKGNRALALPAALVALLADFTATGGVVTAAKVAGGLGATSAAKVGGRKLTEGHADRVLKTVLAGRGAQNAAQKLSDQEMQKVLIRRIIAGDTALNASGLLDTSVMQSILAQ